MNKGQRVARLDNRRTNRSSSKNLISRIVLMNFTERENASSRGEAEARLIMEGECTERVVKNVVTIEAAAQQQAGMIWL